MKILIAVDGSKASVAAVKYAARLYKNMKAESHITLITVQDDSSLRLFKKYTPKGTVDDYLREGADKNLATGTVQWFAFPSGNWQRFYLCTRPSGRSLVPVAPSSMARISAVWSGAGVKEPQCVASRVGKAHGCTTAKLCPPQVLEVRCQSNLCHARAHTLAACAPLTPARWPSLSTGHLAQFFECTQPRLSRGYLITLVSA